MSEPCGEEPRIDHPKDSEPSGGWRQFRMRWRSPEYCVWLLSLHAILLRLYVYFVGFAMLNWSLLQDSLFSSVDIKGTLRGGLLP